jgi:hypothetical protein
MYFGTQPRHYKRRRRFRKMGAAVSTAPRAGRSSHTQKAKSKTTQIALRGLRSRPTDASHSLARFSASLISGRVTSSCASARLACAEGRSEVSARGWVERGRESGQGATCECLVHMTQALATKGAKKATCSRGVPRG